MLMQLLVVEFGSDADEEEELDKDSIEDWECDLIFTSLPFNCLCVVLEGIAVVVKTPVANSKLSVEPERFIGFEEVERQIILNFCRRVGVKTVESFSFVVWLLLVVSKSGKLLIKIYKIVLVLVFDCCLDVAKMTQNINYNRISIIFL